MNNTDLHPHFVAHAESLNDPVWLADFLQPHCRIRRMAWRGNRLRLIQFPWEFARWLMLMASEGVKSYVEIGTSKGGSFYMTDSYLRARVPGYERSVGYDRHDKLRDWPQYQAQFPSTEFRVQNSKDIRLGAEKFDAAFIDARHLEPWVLQDFEKVRHNCRLVGFHDIVLTGSSVDRAWRKIKSEAKEHLEFIDENAPVEARCGIGVVRI